MDQDTRDQLVEVKSDLLALGFLVEMILTKQFSQSSDPKTALKQFTLELADNLRAMPLSDLPSEKRAAVRERWQHSFDDILDNIQSRLP